MGLHCDYIELDSVLSCVVMGQIRTTTVCQAQLFMGQKLKQYIGLVGETEHGGVQPTKVEDLGFWDFQVEDVVKELEDLNKNNG